MPSIELKFARKISKEQKAAFAEKIAEDITIISGKAQHEVMVVIQDDCFITMGKDILENGVFINMNSFSTSDQAQLEEYAVKLFGRLNEYFDVSKDDIYMNLTERSWWGCHGGVVRA